MPKKINWFNVTIILILAQLVTIGAVSGWLVIRFPVFSFFGVPISILVLLFLVKKDEASVYKITWIIIILAVPPLGGIIYLMIGNKRAIRRISAHVREHALIAKLLDSDGNLPFVNQVQCGRMFSLLRYIRQASSYHAYKNTGAKYYTFGELMFADMVDELSKAEKFIFMEFFIIKSGKMWDKLLEVLEKKASEGVEVRLIVDGMGSSQLFSKAYIKELRARNIKVLRFNPMVPFLLFFMNNRDHRKILVIDGKTAFTGGMNISDEYINIKKRFGVWKDTGVMLKGDAVWSFTLMFIEMWDTFCRSEERITDHLAYRDEETDAAIGDGFIVPYGDTPLDNEQLGENIYVDILDQAQRYVYISTPYLIISEKMIHALKMAAKRGVDVCITTPGIPDKKVIFRLTRSYYRYLLEAGVKIFEYTPGFLHAKTMVSDDEVAVVGTINLDYRSLYLHFECATLLYNSSTVAEVRDDALDVISQSRQFLPAEDKKRRIWGEIIDSILHLFAPLM